MIARAALAGAAALAVVLTTWAMIERAGRHSAERALLEYQAAAAQVIAQRLEHNSKLERAHAQQIQEVQSGYQQRVAEIRRRYAGPGAVGLRNPAPASGGALPYDPAAAGGPDGSPDPEACEVTAARLESLQAYICRLPAEVCPACAGACR